MWQLGWCQVPVGNGCWVICVASGSDRRNGRGVYRLWWRDLIGVYGLLGGGESM